MAIKVKYDVFLKKLRESDVGVFAGAIWEELGGNAYRLTGNVGIGISTPLAKLHVMGTTLSSLFMNVLSANGIGYISKVAVANETTYPFVIEAQGGNFAGGIKSTSDQNGDSILLTGNAVTPGQLNETLFLMGDGSVGINTPTFGVDFQVGGYTKLGVNGVPGIKMKQLEITLDGAQGGSANILTGLHSSKIISVVVLVRGPNNTVYPPRHQAVANNEFDYYLTVDSLYVVNHGTNSSNIVSDVATVLITHIE